MIKTRRMRRSGTWHEDCAISYINIFLKKYNISSHNINKQYIHYVIQMYYTYVLYILAITMPGVCV